MGFEGFAMSSGAAPANTGMDIHPKTKAETKPIINFLFIISPF